MHLFLFPSPASPLSTLFREKLALSFSQTHQALFCLTAFAGNTVLPIFSLTNSYSSFSPQILGHFSKEDCPQHPVSVKFFCCVLRTLQGFLHWTCVFIHMTILISLSHKLGASVSIDCVCLIHHFICKTQHGSGHIIETWDIFVEGVNKCYNHSFKYLSS